MRTAIIAAVCLGLAGCNTTYVGHRLPSEGGLAGRPEDNGVPFMLTRPQFVVQKDDKGKYTVTLAYVPDPNQRFSLRMNPALLAKVSFKATYGDNGTLTGLSSSTEDQIVPTVVAVMKLATDVAGGIAAGTAGYQKATLNHGCVGNSSNWATMSCLLGNAVQEPTASGKIPYCSSAAATRLAAWSETFQDAAGKDRGDLLGTIYPRDANEAACLKVVSEAIPPMITAAKGAAEGGAVVGVKTLAEKHFKDVLLETPSRALTTEAQAALDRILAAIEDLDADAIRRIRGGIDVWKANRSVTTYLDRTLGAAREPPAMPSIPPAQHATIAGAAEAALNGSGLAGEDSGFVLTRFKAAAAMAKPLMLAAALPPEQWTQRRIADLDREELLAIQAALIAHPEQDPGKDTTVKSLKLQKAAAVGLVQEHDRLINIRARLADLPRTSASARQSASSEYIVLRDEGERLATLITTRLAEAKGTVKAEDKIDDMPLESPWVSGSCLKASTAANWFHTAGAAAPQYVIILKRAGTAKMLERGTTCELAQ